MHSRKTVKQDIAAVRLYAVNVISTVGKCYFCASPIQSLLSIGDGRYGVVG